MDATRAMAARTDHEDAAKYATMAEANADAAEAARDRAKAASDAADKAYKAALAAEAVEAVEDDPDTADVDESVAAMKASEVAEAQRDEAKRQSEVAMRELEGDDDDDTTVGADENYMAAKDNAMKAATAAGTHVLTLFMAANGAHVMDLESTINTDEKAEHVKAVGAAMAEAADAANKRGQQ